MGSSLWHGQTEGHQVKQNFRKEKKYRMESQAGDFWEKELLKQTLFPITCTLVYTGGKGHRDMLDLFNFFFKGNPQLIHLRMWCCRKIKLPLKGLYLILLCEMPTIKSDFKQ